MRALALVLTVGCLVAVGSFLSGPTDVVGATDELTITHGPMLGNVGTDRIKVWARTSRPGSFVVQYGTNADDLSRTSQAVTTTLDTDCTASVTLSGLKPHTHYHYVVVAEGGSESQRGTFHTLWDSEKLKNADYNPDGLFNFRFEYACGNNQNPLHGIGPSLPVYDTLNAEHRDKLDFAILNGDWLYEEVRDFQPEQWREVVGITEEETPRIVRQMPNITGVWANYRLYGSRSPNLSEWHRNIPSYFTFDDHEILDDVFGTGTAGYRDRRACFRDIGISAWYHYLGWANPHLYEQGIHYGRGEMKKGSDVLRDDAADFTKLRLKEMGNLQVHWGTKDAAVKMQEEEKNLDPNAGDPNAGIYDIVKVLGPHEIQVSPAADADGPVGYSIARRSYSKFRVANCMFYILDTRTHRKLHDKSNPTREDVTMLGVQQREWLMQEMKADDATTDFQFVISSVNFMVPHVGGGGVAATLGTKDRTSKDDAWTVFLHEREMLIDFWDNLESRVFILTGDLHNSYAIKVTDDVWEFASGPHNSVNHRPSDEANRPVNGQFQYGPRPCEIRWSTVAMDDIPRENRTFPHFCVVSVRNVFNNPQEKGGQRFVKFPHPFVVFSFYDALTGELVYAESISTPQREKTAAK